MTLALLVASGIGSAGEASAKGGYSVGQFAYHRLNSAHEYLAEGKTELARNVLNKMGAELRLNAHEQALMWQTHGHIYATEERYDEAAKAFEKSLAANGLPERTELDTRYNLGQLYMATERFAKAVTTLEAWLKKAKNPSGDAHFLVAAAYSQTKRYEPALKHIRAAIAKNDDPPESWLQLMLFLHVERKDLPAGRISMVYQYQRLFLKGAGIPHAFSFPPALFDQPGCRDLPGPGRCRVGGQVRVVDQH